MKILSILFTFFLLPDTYISHCQSIDSLHSVSVFPPSKNVFSAPPLCFSNYFALLGKNIKDEITAPFHFHKKEWTKVSIISLATAGFMLGDESVQRSSLRWRDKSKALRKTSEFISRFGARYEIYTFAGLMSYGLLFKNLKLKNTVMLATQAYITGGVIEMILKYLSGRERPWNYLPPKEAEPTFHGPELNFSKIGYAIRNYNSFPSGHTIEAFAAATVFAREYHDKPIVPIISYTAATLIGLSRITENAHWISDVFAGAAIGYFTGQLIVRNYHRHFHPDKISRSDNHFDFDILMNNGVVEPSITYHF